MNSMCLAMMLLYCCWVEACMASSPMQTRFQSLDPMSSTTSCSLRYPICLMFAMASYDIISIICSWFRCW